MSAGNAAASNEQGSKEVADRISEMPHNVAQRILDCLPLRDAVRTSILSRHWRSRWALLSRLILGSQFFDTVLKRISAFINPSGYAQEYVKVVNSILLRHVGHVYKFVLYIPSSFSKDGVEISQWIECVSAKCVKELTLSDHRRENKVPSGVFSLTSLTHLTLQGCVINSLPATFVGFPHLVSLELGVTRGEEFIIGAHTLEALVSRCPSLESLGLRLYELARHPVICAPRLENLELRGGMPCAWFDGTARIRTLALYTAWERKKDLSGLLGCLPNLEKLTLSDSFWKIDQHGEFVSPGKPIDLARLRILELGGVPLDCRLSVSIALWLLWSSPRLQQLLVNDLKRGPCCGQGFKIEEDDGGGVLPCLKTVEVGGISGSSKELQLAKLLLTSSPLLEVMTVELDKQPGGGAEKTVSVLKEMIRFRRASTNAEIIIKS